MNPASNAPVSVLSADLEIIGEIRTSGSIQIDGKVKGPIVANGDVGVGKSAQIEGDLTVNSISISGLVTGKILARDKIEMKSTARVSGDIKAKRLSVEDGVTFSGHCEVNPSSGSGAPTAAVPPAPAPVRR